MTAIVQRLKGAKNKRGNSMDTNSRYCRSLSFLFVLLFLCLYTAIGQEDTLLQEEAVVPVEDVAVEETQPAYIQENISYQKDRLFVAVNNFIVDGYDNKVANVLSDRFRTELFSTNIFNVIEREQMNMILTEQEFQNSDCVSDACLVEAGQLMGVTHIFTGTVTKIGNSAAVNIRMINVESGTIDFTASTDCRACKAQDLLRKPVKKLIAKVVRYFRPEKEKSGSWVKKLNTWWFYSGVTAVAATGLGLYMFMGSDDEKPVEKTGTVGLSW
ncbi:MAG: hypothetical protein HQK83_04465 [Fibrobacteria bacterium]|nr:hypothetical protein [Fibrobacteria bacterium]